MAREKAACTEIAYWTQDCYRKPARSGPNNSGFLMDVIEVRNENGGLI